MPSSCDRAPGRPGAASSPLSSGPALLYPPSLPSAKLAPALPSPVGSPPAPRDPSGARAGARGSEAGGGAVVREEWLLPGSRPWPHRGAGVWLARGEDAGRPPLLMNPRKSSLLIVPLPVVSTVLIM